MKFCGMDVELVDIIQKPVEGFGGIFYTSLVVHCGLDEFGKHSVTMFEGYNAVESTGYNELDNQLVYVKEFEVEPYGYKFFLQCIDGVPRIKKETKHER